MYGPRKTVAFHQGSFNGTPFLELSNNTNVGHFEGFPL